MPVHLRHASVPLHGVRRAEEAFLKETPFTLILVEFDGADTLFLSRLKGVEPGGLRIGLPVAARFAKTPSFKVTDVWFEPADPHPPLHPRP